MDKCKGIEIEPGSFSGCTANETGATDCPVCGPERKDHDREQQRLEEQQQYADCGGMPEQCGGTCDGCQDREAEPAPCPTCGLPDNSSEEYRDNGFQSWECGRSTHVRDSNENACQIIADLRAKVAAMKPVVEAAIQWQNFDCRFDTEQCEGCAGCDGLSETVNTYREASNA